MAELKLGTTIGGYAAWHEGNDGPNSGLNADLLDGNHSTAFAAAVHGHNYAGSGSDGGAANSVANSLTINNGGSGSASGTTYNGSAAVTISYNSIGAAASNQTMHIGTTAVAINRTSGSLTLTGVNIDGSAGSATTATSVSNSITFNDAGSGAASGSTFNGSAARTISHNTIGAVSLSTAQTITGTKTFTSNILISNATSPNTYYLQFGDNTGWTFRFMTNVSGTPTVRYSFTDTGNFTATGNVTAASDISLKKDLEPIKNAVEKVSQLTGYTFTRTDTGERQTGLIAQEVQKVLPEAVLEGDHLSLAYGNMVGLLIEAIKEQQKRIEDLEKSLRSS